MKNSNVARKKIVGIARDAFDHFGTLGASASRRTDPFTVPLVSVVRGRIPFHGRAFVAAGETFLVFELKAFSDNPILGKRNFLHALFLFLSVLGRQRCTLLVSSASL